MPINSFLYPATQVASSFEVANSCRFEDDNSDYLNRTPSSSGNRKTWTFSTWIKRSELGRTQNFFSAGSGGNYGRIQFNSNDTIYIAHVDGSSTTTEKSTTQVFRDVSSWYHILWHIDTTQGTASNREKFYINGVQVTDFSTNTIPAQDYQSTINENVAHYIGNQVGAYEKCSCYFAEVVFIDGQALDPTSFGEFDSDSNIWKPIDVSGLTFGTNGFYLDFENSSNLGADVSGNGNNFTVNNLTSVDQSTDTCTNNFATLNPLDPSPNTVVFSEGNLVVTGSGGNGGRYAGGTFSLNSGKWWCEIKVTTNGSYPILGIIDSRSSFKRDGIYMTEGSQTAQNRSAYAVFSNSDIYNNGDNNFGDFGTTYTTGDIIGVGLNLDASPPTLTFQKNGSNEVTVNVEVPPSGFYTFPAIGLYYASAKAEVNFGNSPFSISSGVADANGYGLFEYTPKSGYYSCCTKNLAEFG